MNALSHPWLLGGGAVLVVGGFLLWLWAGRHDLKGLALDAAWHVARNRGRLSSASDTEIARRVKDLAKESSHTARARELAGVAARHFLAQVANVAAIVSMLLGALLIAVAFYWG